MLRTKTTEKRNEKREATAIMENERRDNEIKENKKETEDKGTRRLKSIIIEQEMICKLKGPDNALISRRGAESVKGGRD